MRKDRSIVSDVFGGVVRSEFHVEGSRRHTVTYDPFFVLSLPIVYDECSIEDCLKAYFEPEYVEDYKDEKTGRYVIATKKLSFE